MDEARGPEVEKVERRAYPTVPQNVARRDLDPDAGRAFHEVGIEQQVHAPFGAQPERKGEPIARPPREAYDARGMAAHLIIQIVLSAVNPNQIAEKADLAHERRLRDDVAAVLAERRDERNVAGQRSVEPDRIAFGVDAIPCSVVTHQRLCGPWRCLAQADVHEAVWRRGRTQPHLVPTLDTGREGEGARSPAEVPVQEPDRIVGVEHAGPVVPRRFGAFGEHPSVPSVAGVHLKRNGRQYVSAHGEDVDAAFGLSVEKRKVLRLEDDRPGLGGRRLERKIETRPYRGRTEEKKGRQTEDRSEAALIRATSVAVGGRRPGPPHGRRGPGPEASGKDGRQTICHWPCATPHPVRCRPPEWRRATCPPFRRSAVR